MQKTLSVIDLTAIRRNAQRVRALIGDRFFFAVVKADAYGHGAAEVSREIEDIADGFCVAIADEGAELRLSGVTKPVLVLSPPLDRDDVAKMSFYGLTATVTGARSAALVRGNDCHIAINTGMNRYGCYGKELEEALSLLPQGSVKGVYSHLYAAQSERRSREQLAAFLPAVEAVKRAHPGAIAHLSASGGILRGGDFLSEGVRCGILLYGYAPFGFSSQEFTPALRVYARLAQVTRVTGEGVGYNLADEDYEKLCTYRLGYADGFVRAVPLGEKTLCMDAFLSREEKQLLPVMTDARKYAEACGTIPYEVLCSVTKRSERKYVRIE